MNKQKLMIKFINIIQKEKLLTKLIGELFNYHSFHDYNYIFRMTQKEKAVIWDIYDNISQNRFNRYIFNFNKCSYSYKVIKNSDVYLNYIGILNINNSDHNLLKFANLFTMETSKIIAYASSFLDDSIVNCLEKAIKKEKVNK